MIYCAFIQRGPAASVSSRLSSASGPLAHFAASVLSGSTSSHVRHSSSVRPFADKTGTSSRPHCGQRDIFMRSSRFRAQRFTEPKVPKAVWRTGKNCGNQAVGSTRPPMDVFAPGRRWSDLVGRAKLPAQPLGIPKRKLNVAIDRAFLEKDDHLAGRALSRIAALNAARPVAETALALRAAYPDRISHRSALPAPAAGEVAPAALSANVSHQSLMRRLPHLACRPSGFGAIPPKAGHAIAQLENEF